MSKINQLLDGFPNRVPSPQGDSPAYERLSGMHAVRGAASRSRGLLWELPEEDVRVFADDPAADANDEDDARGTEGILPVYGLGGDPHPAVPTERVFVRFAESVSFDSRGEPLAAAGFVSEGALSHAPHAGWVRAASGRVVDALSGVERLRAIPDVVHVEPQMLRPVQRRSVPRDQD